MGIITTNTTFNGIHITSKSQNNLTQNLVTWYPLNGDTLDYSGNNDATNFGAISSNDYYIFDGVNDYMSCNTTFYNDESSFTASSWFYTRAINERSEILDEYPADGSPNYRSIIGYDIDGRFHTLLGGVNNKLDHVMSAYKWYFGAITFNLSTGTVQLHLYDENQHIESKSFSSVSPEHNIITSIGRHGISNYFDGYIRDIRIYDTNVTNGFLDSIHTSTNT